ncbi:unnamed protein product, partial [Ectocarpus sp. 12 AP-2014]
ENRRCPEDNGIKRSSVPRVPGVPGGPSPTVDGRAEGLRARTGGGGRRAGEVEKLCAQQRGKGVPATGRFGRAATGDGRVAAEARGGGEEQEAGQRASFLQHE